MEQAPVSLHPRLPPHRDHVLLRQPPRRRAVEPVALPPHLSAVALHLAPSRFLAAAVEALAQILSLAAAALLLRVSIVWVRARSRGVSM